MIIEEKNTVLISEEGVRGRFSESGSDVAATPPVASPNDTFPSPGPPHTGPSDPADELIPELMDQTSGLAGVLLEPALSFAPAFALRVPPPITGYGAPVTGISGAIWPWLNPPARSLNNNADRELALHSNLVIKSPRAQRLAVGDLLAAMASYRQVHDFHINFDEANTDLLTVEFAVAWWRYLDMRWRLFGEWPCRETQVSTLRQLTGWLAPCNCLAQSLDGSYKGVFPLRYHLDAGIYTKGPVIVKANRSERRDQGEDRHTGREVRDTVREYTLKVGYGQHLKEYRNQQGSA